MEAKDLVVGGKYIYQENPDDKCQATVLAIDNEKEIVKFRDWDDFEWESPFDEIPETIKRKL